MKRLPRTVITEETLKQYLGVETERLNLEHHYWIKDNFIDKIGRMSPNLIELSVRRLKISNRAFSEIVLHLKKLERIDASDCPNISSTSLKILLDNNKSLSQVQLANNPGAVIDEIVIRLSHLENLSFLDISFANQVTDHGLNSFKDKNFPITKLFINGLTGVSANGVADLVGTCLHTLKVFEAALMNQESMNSGFCNALSHAFHLEELDLTGDLYIGDEGISALSKGAIPLENN